MLKLTLVLLVLFIVSLFVTKCMLVNMTQEEKAIYKLFNELPKRLYAMGFVMLLLIIGVVVCGILTIITW